MKSAPARIALFTLLAAGMTGCKEEPRVVAYSVPKPAKTAAAMPANHPPVSGNTPAMTATPGMAEASSGFAAPAWTAPADWRAQPLSSMRKGDWKLGPADAEAQLTVTVFPGDVGGLAANVNRWAQQIGLAPLDAAALKNAVTPRPLAGAPDAVLVRLTHEGRAVLAVSAPHDGATWFFKLSGPAATVEGAEPAMTAFLDSVKFAEAK